MKLVNPVIVTPAMLNSSVPETDYAAWAAGTAYVAGDRVIRTSTHKVYERLLSGTTATAPESDPVNWLDIGFTNRWKVFDQSTGSQTTNAGSIVMTIVPGAVCNTVALLNLEASSVRVKVTDPIEGVVYDITKYTALDNTIGNWDEYFFDYITRTDTLIFLGLPNYINASIEITITEATTAKVGVLAIGRAIELGGAQYGATMGITDYSKKEADDFGGYTLLQRAYSTRNSFKLMIPKEIVNQVKKLLTEVRATPVVWIGSEEYTGTINYGFYKDFNITIVYSTACECVIDIESMT
jgi:hypothetical protein